MYYFPQGPIFTQQPLMGGSIADGVLIKRPTTGPKAGALETCSEQRRDNAEPWPAFVSSWPEAREGRWAKSHEHFLS